jgi:flavin reductase (DIM6/NTAB) family NADH-FMN oxidoreductase RutF
MKKPLISVFVVGLLLVNTTGFADETNRTNEGKEMMKNNKISLGTEIKPMTPVWVIGSYDKAGKANMMTAAWVGICCSKPPCVSIALRKATYTYANIMEREAFTVNIPSKNYVKEADYFGLVSGRDVDKLSATGLTPIKGEKVDAPYLKEFPVAVECKLINTVEVGLHTVFIGEIMDVKADKSMVGDNNSLLPCMLLFNPTTREYYGIGEPLGKAFTVGKEIINEKK